MKINIKFLAAHTIAITGAVFLQDCTEDSDITYDFSSETLATSLMTRSSEMVYLVSVQDNLMYSFDIVLSSLNEGTLKNSFRATVKVYFDHDKATGKPNVHLVDFIAPINYTVNGASISKDLFDGRYKLSATGKDRNGLDCSGTYTYPILIADIPVLPPEEDDTLSIDNDSID